MGPRNAPSWFLRGKNRKGTWFLYLPAGELLLPVLPLPTHTFNSSRLYSGASSHLPTFLKVSDRGNNQCCVVTITIATTTTHPPTIRSHPRHPVPLQWLPLWTFPGSSHSLSSPNLYTILTTRSTCPHLSLRVPLLCKLIMNAGRLISGLPPPWPLLQR
jgi:hypothetical protein